MTLRLYYDSLDEADEDLERITLIQQGLALPKCRMGGSMLLLARKHNIDQCDLCPVGNNLRASLCGGKEKTYKDIHPDFFEAARKSIDAGAGGAKIDSSGGEKRAQRLATIAALERMTR